MRFIWTVVEVVPIVETEVTRADAWYCDPATLKIEFNAKLMELVKAEGLDSIVAGVIP